MVSFVSSIIMTQIIVYLLPPISSSSLEEEPQEMIRLFLQSSGEILMEKLMRRLDRGHPQTKSVSVDEQEQIFTLIIFD